MSIDNHKGEVPVELATGKPEGSTPEQGQRASEDLPKFRKMVVLVLVLGLQGSLLFSLPNFFHWVHVPSWIAESSGFRLARYAAYFQILYWVIGYFVGGFLIETSVRNQSPKWATGTREIGDTDLSIQVLFSWPLTVATCLFFWPLIWLFYVWILPRMTTARDNSESGESTRP